MSSVPITPGSGANIAVDPVSGIDYQIVKLDMGPLGTSIPVVGSAMNGIPVNVTQVQGTVAVDASGTTVPISAAAPIPVSATAPIPVSAPNTAPVSVRLSNGTTNIDTIPISGSTTSAQGTPAAVSNGWPVKITDGASTVGITGGALNVNATGVGGAGQEDSTAFTAGSSDLTPIGGVYNDGITQPSSGQAAAARITQYRGVHVNLRSSGGTEIGTSGAPVRVDPTGTTTQPVSGSVTAALEVDSAAVSATNPVFVTDAGQTFTRVSNHQALAASTTAGAIWTPASGKKFCIRSLILTITGSGSLVIFDGTNASANVVYAGTPPVGATVELQFGGSPWLSAIVNNILQYTSGSGLTGDMVAVGYEVA